MPTLTTISDVVVPSIFDAYVQKLTTELSAFVRAGVALERADIRVPEGGDRVHVPRWNDISNEDDEPRVVDTALTPADIGSDEMVAAVLRRGKAFKSSDLAAELAGSDPMGAIARRIAAFWARNEQRALLAILEGLADADELTTLDISAESGEAAVFDAETFIDAKNLLGDHAPSLDTFCVHSNVAAHLEKADLVDFIRDSVGNDIQTYRGRRLVIDDSLPASDGVYTSYLFGRGAFARATGRPRVPVEVEREALKHNEILVVRRDYILHPLGYAWVGSAAADAKPSPDLTDLADGENWERVDDPKRIPLVRIIHRIAADEG